MSIPTSINIAQVQSSGSGGVARSPNSSSPSTSFVGSGTYSHPASPTANGIPSSPFGGSPQPPGRRVKVIGNYDLGRTIGKGQFGKVKIARHVLTGEKVAVKIIRKLMLDEATMKLVRREINIMKLLKHPHIIRLYEIMETEKTLFLIMEYASGGEVLDFIVAHGRLQENLARRFFAQVVAALEYCHARFVVHRDLKAENMLLDSDLSIKIIDFGLSNHFIPGQMMKTFCGSPTYAAPELIQKKEYCGPEADVWSLGVVLYVFVCGALPFNGHDFLSLFTKILNCDYHIPDHVSPDCRSLIQRMLVVNPDFRATLDDVKNSRWLASEQATMGPLSPIDLRPALDLNPDLLDDVILKHMEIFGYSREAVAASIKANQCNAAAATYILLLEKKTKMEASPTRTPSSGALPGVRTPRKAGATPQQGPQHGGAGGGSRRGHRRTQTADNPIIIERDAYGNPSAVVSTHREQQQQNYILQQQQAQQQQQQLQQQAHQQAQLAQQQQQQQLFYYQQQIQNQLQLLQQQQGAPQQQVVQTSASATAGGKGTTSIYLIPKNPQQAAAVIAGSAPATIPVVPSVSPTPTPAPTAPASSVAPSHGHRRTRSIETNQYPIANDMDVSSPRTLLQQQQAIQVHEKLQHHRRTSSSSSSPKQVAAATQSSQPTYDKPPLYPTTQGASSGTAATVGTSLHPPSLVITVATPTSSPPVGPAMPHTPAPGTGSGGKGSHRRTMSIATTPNHRDRRGEAANATREKEEEDNFFFIPSPASASPHVPHHHPHPPSSQKKPAAQPTAASSKHPSLTSDHHLEHPASTVSIIGGGAGEAGSKHLPIPLHLLQEHPTIASVSGDLSPRSRPSSSDGRIESPRAIVPPDQSQSVSAQLSNHDRATLALEAEEAAEKELEKKSQQKSTTLSPRGSPPSSTSPTSSSPPVPPPAPPTSSVSPVSQTSISSLISSLKSWLIRKDSSEQQAAMTEKTQGQPKEPRTVRSALTATSTKAPDVVLAEIKRALHVKGVRGKLTSPFCFECRERTSGISSSAALIQGTKVDSASSSSSSSSSTAASSSSSTENPVHFEMEVCSLPGLTRMYYIRTKRIGGDWARYKTICRELIDEMKL